MPTSPRSRRELEELLLRIPNPPDPDVPVGGEEASVIVRTWGEPAAHERDDGDHRAAALGGRRGAGHHRPGRRRQGHRLRLPDLPRRRRRAPARAHRLLPRPPHARARHDRDLAAGARQRGVGARHRPDPGQGRPDVRRHARRPVPGADRGGAGHQHPPRRDHRGGPAAHPLRRLLALLPARGRRRRRQDRAASCASTSSTRSRWSASSARTTRTRRSSG